MSVLEKFKLVELITTRTDAVATFITGNQIKFNSATHVDLGYPAYIQMFVDDKGKQFANIGGYFSGNRTYTVRLDEQLHFWVEDMFMPTPTNFDIPVDNPMTKEEFLGSFAELHVGEWRKYYRTERFGYVVLDGTQWELTIEYSNGRKAFTSGGSNSYPYNFQKLTELFGIEEEDEDPEEDE